MIWLTLFGLCLSLLDEHLSVAVYPRRALVQLVEGPLCQRLVALSVSWRVEQVLVA